MNQSQSNQRVPQPRKSSRKQRAPALTVTGTAELVLAPRVRRFAARAYVGAAGVVLVLVLIAIGAVHYLSVVEPMLAAEGTNAARAIAYELPVGRELHVPIEPHTDLLRFIVHAYGKSDMPLTPHPARLELAINGANKQRTEDVRAEVPGLRSRVTPESPATGVGDPIAFEVDVHDAGVGEVIVKLADIQNASGLLVRAYRREQLSDAEVALRNTALDRTKKDELARWTWELGWDELGPAERLALLQARWRRVGALRGASTDLRSTTIAVAPPPPHESPPVREELLGRVALRGDERVALVLRPHTEVRFISDEATVLTAIDRTLTDSGQHSASGSLSVGPFDNERSVELGADRDVLLEVRTSNADGVEWLGYASVWRTSTTRPVVVASPDQDRVVRVSVRKPMRRDAKDNAKMAASIEITGAGPQIVSKWTGEKPRSRVDRYEDFDAPEAPSERAAFFVALPKGSKARIFSSDGSPLDISLAELDPDAPPMALTKRPPDTPPPLIVAETEDTKSSWIPRRPSNAGLFEDENAHRVVRTAHWYAPAPPPPAANTAPLGHAKHTDSEKLEIGGRDFDGVAKTFDLDTDARRPLYLPIYAEADVATKLSVFIEQPKPKFVAGVFQRWTLGRTIEVTKDVSRSTFIIGDDVPPPTGGGKLRLHVIADPATNSHVSLPWQIISTRQSTAAAPRWLSGGFEE